MRKSKNAFTMIELIFVIVILGILGVVAIPKLAATRADAQTARKSHLIMTGVTEIVSYAVSKGQVESNFSDMSNSLSVLANSDNVLFTTNKAIIPAGSISDCITIQIVGASDENLTLIFGNSNSDVLCSGVQSLIDLNTFPINLKGTSVVY